MDNQLQILTAVQEFSEMASKGIEELREQNNQITMRMHSIDQHVAQGQSVNMGMPGNLSPADVLAHKLGDSEALHQLRNRQTKSAQIPLQGVTLKQATGILVDDGSTDNTNYAVQAQRLPGIYNDPQRSLSLLDVLPALTVSSASFEFTVLDSFTDQADYQLAQGASKAKQDLTTDVKTVNIVTIAVTQKASEQVLSDEPALLGFLSQRMVYSVRQKFEYELINGTAGAGKITGLVSQAQEFTPSAGAAPVDAIGEAIAHLHAVGWNAGAVVLSPNTWHAIRSERTSAGDYVATGWNQPAQPNIWGVPVVVSASLADDTVLVLDPQQVALLDRQMAVFELGFSDDDFIRNLITARAEVRAGLAVLAPSAVQKIVLQ